MSEQPQGPGWWQASDGKFYPPESAPGQTGSAGQTSAAATATTEAPAPKKPLLKRWWFWLLVAIGLLIVIGLVSGGGDADDTASTSPPAEPTTEEPTATEEPDEATETEAPAQPEETEEPQEPEESEFVIPGEGTFAVGADIAPGIYYANSTSSFAYWARLSDASGDFDAIIANGNPSGQAVVEIREGDAFFETSGVDGWRPISEIPRDPKPTIPGDGIWIVGVQIEPGTYSGTTESDFAYWARLSDASGDFDAIIANDNPSGNAIVEIAETDAYFETSGVAGWSKSG